MKTMTMTRRKASDLSTYNNVLTNNLLGLNLLQSKMGLTFQSLYNNKILYFSPLYS